MSDDNMKQFMESKPIVEALDKFEELMKQDKRIFLIGAGCSFCAGLPLMGDLTKMVLESELLSENSKTLLASVKESFANAEYANIEDYLSEIIDFLSIAERRTVRAASECDVGFGELKISPSDLEKTIDEIKQAISKEIEPNAIQIVVNHHRQFIKAVHQPIRPGKFSSNSKVDYICLNYDTLLEDSLALEKVPHTDGLRGGGSAWWDSDEFQRKDILARVIKLHGSINWYGIENDHLPMRLSNTVSHLSQESSKLMIWPAATKYRETQLDPYSQLFDIARKSINTNDGSSKVLVVCGYSFGDSHVNFEIDRSLKESDGKLTIVIFTTENIDTTSIGKTYLSKWLYRNSESKNIIIFASNGYFHGEESINSDSHMEWWKFENVIKLMKGER